MDICQHDQDLGHHASFRRFANHSPPARASTPAAIPIPIPSRVLRSRGAQTTQSYSERGTPGRPPALHFAGTHSPDSHASPALVAQALRPLLGDHVRVRGDGPEQPEHDEQCNRMPVVDSHPVESGTAGEASSRRLAGDILDRTRRYAGH